MRIISNNTSLNSQDQLTPGNANHASDGTETEQKNATFAVPESTTQELWSSVQTEFTSQEPMSGKPFTERAPRRMTINQNKLRKNPKTRVVKPRMSGDATDHTCDSILVG